MRTPNFRVRRLSRSGKIVVLTALLMPVIVGGLALSVDTAILATARAHLQTVADAASLAGAMQLASDRRVSNPADLSPEMTAARSKARSIGQANKVLGSSPVIIDNTSNSPSGDIVIGYLSATDYSNSAPDSTAAQATFNSVLVRGTRDPTHAGGIPSYFGVFQGVSSTPVSVKATATVLPYAISGLRQTTGSVQLLPIVLREDTYNAMIASPPVMSDLYSYDPATGRVSPGQDGVYESVLYPVRSNPGNWGTINIGVSNNSTSNLGSQIRYGITPAQMATYPNSTIQLDTSLNPPQITFSGDPGISAGVKDDLAAIIGRAITIPIYDVTGGNGNNAWYRVIKFAGVRILDVNFSGTPKYVIVQPALVNDANAIAGESQPWTSGGLIRLHLSR
jgi:Flp pilus assembly protein TadG